MAIPNVTPYSGQKPIPGQDQPTFNQNMSDELDYFNALPAELNPAINAINQTATDVDNAKTAAEAAASEAATSATAAAASGNYQGEFTSGVTSATAGESYSFDDSTWFCLVNTTTDPAVGNANWRKVVSVEDVNAAEERAIGTGVSIYRGTGVSAHGGYVHDGDVVPSKTPPYTHLRVLFNGKPENVLMSPAAKGLVTNLSETGATIGGTSVAFINSAAGYNSDDVITTSERLGVSKTNHPSHNGLAISILCQQYRKVIVHDDVDVDSIVIDRPGVSLEFPSPITKNMSNTEGAVGLLLKRGALNCTFKNASLRTMANSQTAHKIDGYAQGSIDTAPQYNRFYDCHTDGDSNNLETTSSLILLNTWSNSWYGCYFNRTNDGVIFGDENNLGIDGPNANNFYGCELRSINTASNGGSPIKHYSGRGNAFVGGVIENWKKEIQIHAGQLTFCSGLYTEAFASASMCDVYEGHLNINGCTLAGPYIFMRGAGALRFKDNGISSKSSSYNYPLIQNIDNSDCDIDISGNYNTGITPITLIRPYETKVNGSWTKRTGINRKEKVQHGYSNLSVRCVADDSNVTGDGTEYTVRFGTSRNAGKIYDEGDEFDSNSGVFTSKLGGIHTLTGNLRLSNLVSGSLVTLKIITQERDIHLYSATTTNSGNLSLQFSATLQLLMNQNISLSLAVYNQSKTVTLTRGDATNSFTRMEITRV